MTLQWEAQVVGINYYPNYTTLHSLTAAANDAEAVAIQLETYGYQTFRVQRLPRQVNQKGEWQINPKEAVKSQELQEAIANLFNPPDGQAPETALFFFSGHGWRKTVNGKEEVFLATSDVFLDEGIYGVSLSWLGEQLKASQTKQLIVWLDCCYSGELLKYLPTNKDYCIITATRSYEPGIEIVHQEGLFTQALREGLNPDNYPDGIVDSHSLTRFLEKRMAQTAQAPRFAISDRSILITTKFNQKNFQDRCPYRSLSFFSEKPEDAQVFHGRTKLTRQLVEKVREKQRLIAVFGASGNGKSSLIRAGLLYQLKLGQTIAESNNWTYLEPFTPTDEPLQRLSEAGTFAPTNDQNPIILIIDQFEECFTMCDEQKRKAFIARLTELLDSWENLQIIIGMRDDFRRRLREFPEFDKQMSKVNVGDLNHEEIREAIEKPAEWVGLGIGEGLKQQLINDVEDDPNSLPLLQYTLTELWNEARKQGERFLRLETYQQLGGIEGTLEIRADEVYESLSEEEKSVAKRIFLELTQVGDTLNPLGTRRRVRLGDLVNSHHLLEILDSVTLKLANEQNRLITRTEKDEEVSQGKSQILIDVVHEALIRHWKRLQEWQQAYREGMVIERKIEASAQDWETKGKKSDYLLQGTRLGEAEEYVKTYGNLGMLDGMAEEFIQKSTDNRRRSRLIRTGVIAGFVGVVTLGTAASTIFGLDANRQKTIAQLKEQASNVQVGLTAEKNVSPLILAIQTAGKNLKFNKNLFPEVQGSLFEAIDIVRERNILNDHEGFVNSVAISADGQRIVSGGDDGTVRLWDSTGKPIGTPLTGHEGSVNSVAISADGQRIVSGGKDGTVRMWDSTGKPIGTPLTGHEGSVNSVAISADGQRIVSGGKDGTVRMWDSTGKPIGTPLTGYEGEVRSVAISADGQRIVSGGDDGTVRLWDSTGKTIGTPFGHERSVRSVAISADGQRIVSGGKDGTVRLWDSTGKLIGTFKGHEDSVYSVAISADGQRIVSGGKDATMRLWDSTGKAIGTPLKGHKGSVYSVAFSPNGQRIVSGSDDGTMRLWDSTGKATGTPLKGHKGEVRSVAISADEQRIVSGGYDGMVGLWDSTGKPIVSPWKGHKGSVNSVAISADGQRIVSGGYDGMVGLWDSTGKPIVSPWKGHKGSVNSVAISTDGQIVSGGQDGKVKLWDSKGKPIKTPWKGHKGSVNSVAISTDGQIVSGGYDGMVGLWDSTGKPIVSPWKGHDGRSVNSVAISTDGQIVSGGDDSTIRLWDSKGKPIKTPWKGHYGSVYSVAISADGQRIVSGGDDSTIRLWDSTGKTIGTPFGYEGEVRSVAISADGQRIISGGDDGTVRLWQGGTWQDWLAIGCGRLRLHPDFTSPSAENDTEEEKIIVQGAVKTCWEHGKWSKPEKAEFLVRQGLGLAQEKRDFAGAKAKFQQAHQLDAANVNLAKLEAEARRLAASTLLEKGITQVKQDNVTEALSFYDEARKLGKIDAESWNKLCLWGSLYRHAKDVLIACDNAVKFAPDAADKASWRDARGLARALTEDNQGAITDFQAFVDYSNWPEEYKDKRKQWIEALKKGKNPFTDEVLEQLKKEQNRTDFSDGTH